MQFTTPSDGWATAFYIVVSNGHVSQYSTVVHTFDGGKTWRPVKGVETYGVEVEPAFWFVDTMRGWIGWPNAWEAEDRMLRTVDGGRHWTPLPIGDRGVWPHLRFFDSDLGYAVTSTLSGPDFYVTRDGGSSWARRGDVAALRYPGTLVFLNPAVGWLAGTARTGESSHLRLLWSVDGGETWQPGSLPADVPARVRDLFFASATRGWLIAWKDDATGTLLGTLDGGRTWTSVADPRMNGTILASVRFVSAEVGFVFASASFGEPTGQSSEDTAVLFSTQDGGQNWHASTLPSAVQACDVVAGAVWCTSGMDIVKVRPTR